MYYIQKLAEQIQQANKILVLTGAGISTESGIPDFRSKEGLYQYEPEEIMSRQFFFEKPKIFYDFVEKNLYLPNVQPNDGHKVLAQLEQMGKKISIVTQNIDGLHQKAGSQHVIEYHGTIKTATCYNVKCKKPYTLEEILERKQKNETYYICDCGPSGTKRYIKPDIVLYGDYGQWMTTDRHHKIRSMAWSADLILVLGTSLSVSPFNTIVRYRNKRIPTVIINKGSTPFDSDKNVTVIRESIGETLAMVQENLE